MSQSLNAAIILATDRGDEFRSSAPKSLHCVAGEPLFSRVISATQAAQFTLIGFMRDPEVDVLKPKHSSVPSSAPSSALLSSFPEQLIPQKIPPAHSLWLIEGDLLHLSTELLLRLEAQLASSYSDTQRAPQLQFASIGIDAILWLNPLLAAHPSILSVLQSSVDELTIPKVRTCAEQLNASLINLTLRPDDLHDLSRVHHRIDLARAEERAQTLLAERAMLGGATLLRPATVRLEAQVQIGQDVLIEEDVTLCGETIIESGVVIERGCRVMGSHIKTGAHLRAYSHIESAVVGEEAVVGPFARLREGTYLERSVRVGNFVEIKKSILEEGAKANHLSYLGDAKIGRDANIGAGTITCNYDGYHKHQTEVGAGAFIGSDTQLVAPVRVGEGAIVAAGTTVTQDVEPHAIMLTRAPVVERPGGAARFRERQLRSHKN